ncbi:U-box domain-containing protein [Nemania sp. FL0916]|nr:U-box domain-containing protein [Nemania sp. FL0916]
MSTDPGKATKLKDEGNTFYNVGNYPAAEGLYSQAIISDSENPALYTNRAMARLRQQQYESAAWDCHACLKLGPDNLKAHFILSQCLLAQHDPDDALEHALQAHRLAVAIQDRSLAQLTAQVLRCKRARWEKREQQRRREVPQLESELISLLERDRDDSLGYCNTDLEKRQVAEEFEKKTGLLRSTFEAARSQAEKRRKVPDWAIDDISFCVMVDPVVTESGNSYERAAIVESLRHSQIDPHSRKPLRVEDLRPNIALREACEQFLEENGWAADW